MKKWKLAIMMSVGIAISYVVRVNISHAIIPIAEEFKIGSVQQGLILSAFSWGYVALMFIGGLLVDKIGARKMSIISAVCWSFATIVSSIGFSWPMIFSSELCAGASEAPIFPANAKIVKYNYKENERGRATAIFDAGSYVGTAISAPIMMLMIVLFNWRIAFIVTALLGIIWVFFWKRFSKGIIDTKNNSKEKTDFKEILSILKNKKIIGVCVGFFCYNYIKNFFLTWFPSYLVTERNFELLNVGLWGMIPSLGAVIGGISAGIITDKLITLNFSLTFARKLPLCIGMLLSSSIVLANFVTSDFVVLFLMTFSFAMAIAASPSIWAIPGDIAPRDDLIGTIGGIQNTFSNIAGIVAPIFTGYLVSVSGDFSLALVVTAAIAIVGALFYLFVVGKLERIKVQYNA